MFCERSGNWFRLSLGLLIGMICAAAGSSAVQAKEAGRGRFDLSDASYDFSVVQCDLEDVPDATGYTYEIYVLGRGVMGRRPFFIELERGRRGGDPQAAIRFYWTSLPQGWWHGGLKADASDASVLDRVHRADGFESVSRWGLLPEQLVVTNNEVSTHGPIRFLRLKGGTADAQAGVGEISLTCPR